MDSFRYVILGGGVVAGYAAKQLAQAGLASGELCILSADNAPPCERPPLSKKFLAGQKEEDSVYINEPDFYARHGIDLRLNTIVRRVDLAGRRLGVDGQGAGGEVRFEKLLIATGARVRKLGVPGADLENIFYLRWLQDAKAIRAAYESSGRAVIVGGGYIGTEVAAVLKQKGLDVTMVFPGRHLLERVFAPEIAAYFEEYYQQRGVKLLKGSKVARFAGSGRVASVVLESGENLPADMVVAGIGVDPATDLFEGASLRIDDGIVVNEYLETSVPGVYAAGDVARFNDLVAGRQRRVEHWDNAVCQGEHAASLLAGRREAFRHLAYFFSDAFDLSWELWGDRREAEQVVYRGPIGGGRFSAWWLDREDRLVSAFVMNRPDEERELAQKWIKEKTRLVPEALREPSAPIASAGR